MRTIPFADYLNCVQGLGYLEMLEHGLVWENLNTAVEYM